MSAAPRRSMPHWSRRLNASEGGGIATGRLLAGVAATALMLAPLPASAQQIGPMSVIDWLRPGERAEAPGAYPLTPPGARVADSAISVRPLDALRPEAIGLFPAARVGLPSNLWGATPADTLAQLITALPTDMLPALRDLSLRLLLAEFDAPLPEAIAPNIAPADDHAPTRERPDFLMARIDKLIEFGALDQAAAILDALDPSDPHLRLRRFDIGLLLGDEHRACASVLLDEPPIGDDAAMIFCLARESEWDKALDLLHEAEDAQRLSPYLIDLLEHFLDGNERLPGAATLLPPPSGTPSPLVWRLLEATGDQVPTLGLPVSYAHADLRGTIGWRAQLEAAERLVRAGALSPNRLLGLYTERRAAASGGIWERVRLVQRFDSALHSGDTEATAAALIEVWPQIQAGELEVPMAELYAQSLGQMALSGAAGALAFRVGLLSDSYETVALGRDMERATSEERFLAAVARGLDPALHNGAMTGEVAQAVGEAFAREALPAAETQDRLAEGRLGEEVLRVLIQLGGPADPRMLAEGLSVLRYLGLEDIARRTALESLLLNRRG